VKSDRWGYYHVTLKMCGDAHENFERFSDEKELDGDDLLEKIVQKCERGHVPFTQQHNEKLTQGCYKVKKVFI
jgi:hypothetical protein